MNTIPNVSDEPNYAAELDKLADVRAKLQQAEGELQDYADRQRVSQLSNSRARATEQAEALLAGESLELKTVNTQDAQRLHETIRVLRRAEELQSERCELARREACFKIAKGLRPRYEAIANRLAKAIALAVEANVEEIEFRDQLERAEIQWSAAFPSAALPPRVSNFLSMRDREWGYPKWLTEQKAAYKV